MARSRNSGEYFDAFFMTLSSQELESPGNPRRFIRDQWRQVDIRGAERSVSLCQIGLRWLKESLHEGFLLHLFTGIFKPLEAS